MNNRRKEINKSIALGLLIWTTAWGLGLGLVSVIVQLLGGTF